MDTTTNTDHQMEDQHVHTVYEAKGGGYICSGCEKRFVDPSSPSMHIGMEEPVAWMTKDQDPAEFVPAWVRDAWVKDGGPTSEYFIPRYPTPLFANAHTKAVTVDAIVKLAEEWDAYCVVTPTDPDGIEDFRTRLLKLIQE